MQYQLEESFKASYQEYGDAIFRFCLMKVSDVARAEDMTQEVFMRYWQSLRAGKEMTNTRSFLYTIAHNLAKDWYKRKKADSLDTRMEQGYDPAAREASPELMAAYAEALASIEHLAEEDRDVLLLTYVEGLDPRDIALMKGSTANAISVRINRAVKRLQKLLHAYET